MTGVGACGRASDEASPSARDPRVLLELEDGLRITADDLEGWDEYFDELDPTLGRKYRLRVLLDQHLLPLAAARRAFAAERAELRARAEALRAVADNHAELVRKGTVVGGTTGELPFTRSDLPLPVARYLFRDENTLGVSPVLEVPRGFVLAAAENILRGITTVGDRVAAFLVTFDTHTAEAFYAWWGEQRRSLAGTVTYVAPELEGALPDWLVVH